MTPDQRRLGWAVLVTAISLIFWKLYDEPLWMWACAPAWFHVFASAKNFWGILASNILAGIAVASPNIGRIVLGLASLAIMAVNVPISAKRDPLGLLRRKR